MTSNKFKFRQNIGLGCHKDKRFKPAVDDECLDELSVRSFSVNTDCKVQWVCEMYHDWWFSHVAQVDCDSRIKWAQLEMCQTGLKANFCYSLCHFLSEIRRKDGNEYPGKTLHEIMICMQFYLQKVGVEWKLLDDPAFVKLRHTLDNLIKQCAEMGVGQRKRAESIFESRRRDVVEGSVGRGKSGAVARHSPVPVGCKSRFEGGKNTSSCTNQASMSKFKFW